MDEKATQPELRQLVHDAWSTHHQRHGHRRCSSAADGDLRSTVSLSLSLARRRISSSVAAVGALPTSSFDLGSKDSNVESTHQCMVGLCESHLVSSRVAQIHKHCLLEPLQTSVINRVRTKGFHSGVNECARYFHLMAGSSSACVRCITHGALLCNVVALVHQQRCDAEPR
mgnify:CR=1 FL=1